MVRLSTLYYSRKFCLGDKQPGLMSWLLYLVCTSALCILCLIPVVVNLHCQLDGTLNHLGDTPLNVSGGGVFLEGCNWGGKTQVLQGRKHVHHQHAFLCSSQVMTCDQLPHAPASMPFPTGWTVSLLDHEPKRTLAFLSCSCVLSQQMRSAN